MIKAILRRIGIGFIMTALLSELLKERARVFDRLDGCCHARGCCHTRGGGKETLLMGRSEDFYIRSALGGTVCV